MSEEQNSLTLYFDGLTTLRRESSIDGEVTLYVMEQLSCDDPVMVATSQSFAKQSDALEALTDLVRDKEQEAEITAYYKAHPDACLRCGNDIREDFRDEETGEYNKGDMATSESHARRLCSWCYHMSQKGD